MPFSNVSIVDFEQVNVSWVTDWNKNITTSHFLASSLFISVKNLTDNVF